MTKDLKPFARGFRSTDYMKRLGIGEWEMGDESGLENDETTSQDPGEERAVVTWATNSLQIKVPADNEREMTVAAAFVSREEFLHGKWAVAILNTLGHLSLAADDALARLVSSSHPEFEPRDYLECIADCERTIETVFAPMSPFVEAVDKFQLLTVIDEGFVSGVESTYKGTQEEDTDEEFREYFYKILDTEEKIATGKLVPPGEDRYVNPQYFHALADIVITWESMGIDDPIAENDIDRAQAREVAETVARVTLDVPQPIEPLGSERFSWFDPLATPGVELDALAPQELIDDARYPMTKDDFHLYLGRYPDIDESEQERIEETLEPDEWSFEYTYEEAQYDWVARVFVNVRKALEDLREEHGIEIAEDTEKLRELLVERVHGESVTESMTMLSYPTALVDVPQLQDTPSQDEDVMSAEGSPLSKVLLESFEHHGSFGAVVYDLTAEETKYELNWHAKGEQINREDYQHVPEANALPDDISRPDEGIVYEDLWRSYFLWEGLRQHLIESYVNYRDALIENLMAEFDTVDELERELKRVKGRMETESDHQSAQKPRMSARRAKAASKTDQFQESLQRMGRWGRSEGFEKDKEKERTEMEMREIRDRWATAVLKQLAAELNSEPDISSFIEDVDCPLCSIHSGQCGRKDSCTWAETREQFDSQLPKLITQLVEVE